MKSWHIFPPDLTKPCTAKHDTAGWELTSHPSTHPSNGAPTQVFDVPDNTPDGNGVSLFIADNPKPYHGVLYLNLPTGVGMLIDIFPFKPASPTTSARRGLVRLAGRMLVDDDGPFNPLGVTMFYAIGRAHNGEQDRVKSNLQYARKFSYDFVRILCQVAPNGLWSECPIDPMWPTFSAELADMIDSAYDCGLRTKLTVIGGGDPDPVSTSRKVANVVIGRQHKVLLLEPINEHNGDPDDAARMVPILQSTGCLVVPGFGDIAPGWGIEDIKALTERSGADGCAYHTSRSDGDNGARQVRQCWDFKDFGSRMADDGEGPGPGASVADFPDPFKNATKAAANMICGASLRCAHTGDGVYGKSYQGPTGPRYANLSDRPNAELFFSSVRHSNDHLPPEIANWQKYNVGFPVEIASGTVNKMYGAKSGDRAFQIPIGCETAVVMRATKPVSLKLWNPATGESAGEYRLAVGQSCRPDVQLWAYVMEINP